MDAGSGRPDIADLVPHTRVARLLTRVVSSSPLSIEAVGEIPRDHPLAIDDLAPAFLAVELGAQAAAAMQTLASRTTSTDDADPQPGRLVRIRDARFARESLPVSTPIAIAAERVGLAPPLAIYKLRATINGAVVVEAVISTYGGQAGQVS